MRALACAALVVALGVSTSADERRPDEKRTIAVTGRGEVKAMPDRVAIAFAVETTASRASEAATDNARRSAAVAAALRSAVGADGTVTTTRYSVEPRYESKAAAIAGYVARNEVQVESGAVDRVGALVDAGIGAGANRVGSLAFTVSQRDDRFRAALGKAAADAQAQADATARGLGVHLKGVFSATVVGAPVFEPRRVGFAAMASEAAPPTPIEPGETTISATVNVTYEIE
jgi:uncharacterized protein YggE